MKKMEMMVRGKKKRKDEEEKNETSLHNFIM